MNDEEIRQANKQTQEAWNTNAAYWDNRMGEGNDWFEKLVWPVTGSMLKLKAGDVVLDIACGNGLTSRRMAATGAEVVAFDFAHEMIVHARKRTTENLDRIEYLVLDAKDENTLVLLGKSRFDAALCNMALFDMAEIDPLMRALVQVLKPKGKFVFSIMHPCFNNPYVVHVGEMEERESEIIQNRSIKVSKYLTPSMTKGIAMVGQPKPQIYFHRPLQDILNACFNAGFALDAFAETAFPPGHPPGAFLSWSDHFSEIPPVLVARMILLY